MHDAFLKVWERWGRVRHMDRPGWVPLPNRAQRDSGPGTGERRSRNACSAGPRSRDPLEDVEGRDRVDRALAALTVRQREAVILTDLLDYNV